MKKLVMIAIAFIAITATAQRGGGDRATHNLTAEEVASLQTKKMTLALVLSEAQIKKVHKIHLEQAEKRKAMREARKNEKEDSKSEKDRFAHRENMLDERIAVQNKMQQILDEDQFKLWRKMALRQTQGKGRKGGERPRRGGRSRG